MKKLLSVRLNIEVAVIAMCGLGVIAGLLCGLAAGTITSYRVVPAA